MKNVKKTQDNNHVPNKERMELLQKKSRTININEKYKYTANSNQKSKERRTRRAISANGKQS